MTARAAYASIAAGIFIAELAIAAGVVAGPFVRGSVGDVLAIALIYFSLRAWPSLAPTKAAGIAIATGFMVEVLQLLHIAELMGLDRSGVLHTLVGNTYSLADLAMYVVGGGIALALDRYVLAPHLVLESGRS